MGTAHDGSPPALRAVRDEWSRPDLGYQARVAHLRNGGGHNGNVRLYAATVFDDQTADTLLGWTGTDWFWAGTGVNPDIVSDPAADELVN